MYPRSRRPSSSTFDFIPTLPETLFDQSYKLCHSVFLFVPTLSVPQSFQQLHPIRITLLLRPSRFPIIEPASSPPSPPTSPPSKPSPGEPAPPRFFFRIGLDGCGVDALECWEKCGVCFEELLKFRICGEDGKVGLLLEVAWDGRWWWRLGERGRGSC